MEQSKHAHLIAMGAAGVILAVFFLLVMSGARTYRAAVAGQVKNSGDRALRSYVMSYIKSGDAEGAVRVYDVDGAPVVAVEEAGSGYGIRIYQREGKLLGDYGGMDSALNPKRALVIGDTEKFQVEELENDTYAVTTDVGRTLFHVRSGMD